MLTFMAAPIIGFAFVVYPVRASVGLYSLHFWPFAAALELFLVALMGEPLRAPVARPPDVGGPRPRLREGLHPGSRRRAPSQAEYEVTRKHDEFRWYWRETLVQTGFLLLLIGTLAYSLATTSLVSKFDVGSAYWAMFL